MIHLWLWEKACDGIKNPFIIKDTIEVTFRGIIHEGEAIHHRDLFLR